MQETLRKVFYSNYNKRTTDLSNCGLPPVLESLCGLLIGSIHRSEHTPRFLSELSVLRQQPPEVCKQVLDLSATAAAAYYLLSYCLEGEDRRRASELWISVLRRGGEFVVDPLPVPRGRAKIKLLFVGMYLLQNNNGTAVLSSVFRDRWRTMVDLSSDRYEKHLLLSPEMCGANVTHPEAKTVFRAMQHVRCFPSGKVDFAAEVAKIRDGEFDVVLFASIGMHPVSTLLAMNRLAPVQLTTWGHSCTSGIDTTMDGFVSSELYEKGGGGQKNYTEPLLLHKGLGTCYRLPTFQSAYLSREELGLPADCALLSCLQSPSKLTPPFVMDVLSRLLARFEPGSVRLLLLSGPGNERTLDMLGCDPSAVVFVPPCKVHRFQSYLNCSTIVLDVHPFGGCNGSLEAFALGKVVLTWPSESLPGRFTLGFYRRMELGDSMAVVESPEEYVEAGVRLASDRAGCRAQLERLIRSRSSRLYDDDSSVREWDEMLAKMVDRARMPPPASVQSRVSASPLRFVHITKTAGTSIEDLFLQQFGILTGRHHKEYGPWHEPFSQKSQDLQLRHKWFTVVRNPYDRILSEFHCRWHGAAGASGMQLSTAEANRLLRDQIRCRPVGNWHYVPQHLYLPTSESVRQGVRMHVVRYEALQTDLHKLLKEYGLLFDSLPQTNRRRQTYLTRQDLDSQSLSLINQVYRKDFQMFGYSMRPAVQVPQVPLPLSKSAPRVCVLVVTCEQNVESITRRIAHCPRGVFCLLGQPDLPVPFSIGTDRVIRLRCSDKYLGLPEKMAMAAHAFCSHAELKPYTHMYKVDDVDFDKYTFCCPTRIQPLMDQVQKSHYCGGSLNPSLSRPNRRYHFKVNETEFFWNQRAYTGNFVEYLQGGDGYILSRSAANVVRRVWSDTDVLRRSEPYEDLMVGKALLQHCVRPVVLPDPLRYILPIAPVTRNITYVTGLWRIPANPKRDFETEYKPLVAQLLQTVLPGQKLLFYYADEEVSEFVRSCNTRGCRIVFEKAPIPSLPSYAVAKEYVSSCTRQAKENTRLLSVAIRMSDSDKRREKGIVHALRDLKSGAYLDLFTVWTSKIYLVADATQKRPFSEGPNDRFAWIDAGACRFGLDPALYLDDTRPDGSIHLFRSPSMLYMGNPLPVHASFMVGLPHAWKTLRNEFSHQLHSLKNTMYGHDEETLLYHVWLQQRSPIIQQIELDEGVDYDFIEIGTSNFNTLTEKASDKTRGIAVEPLRHYLEQLPVRYGVVKDNVAVSSKPGSARVYYIPEIEISKHGLQPWFKGCNSLHGYHPLHLRHNVTHLCRAEEVDVVTPEQLWRKHRVRRVATLKIDTEGHDCVILKSLHDFLRGKPRHLWPATIQFESNEHTAREDVDNTIHLYQKSGYVVVSRGHDTVMRMLIPQPDTVSKLHGAIIAEK